MAPSSSRNGARVIWITVHTAEGIRDADDLKAYFDRSTVSSAHACADDTELVDNCVPYDRAAWTLRNGNEESDNLELCGFASWSRAEWLNNHQGMLNNAARWIRARCQARGVPMVKIGPADVGARRAGVIGHVDYTNGTGDGTHWDPGPGFPWDVVMAIARGEEDMQADERGWLADVHMVTVSGARRDKQLNKDLGYIVDQVADAQGVAAGARAEAQQAKTAAVSASTTASVLVGKVDQLAARVDQLALGGVDVNALAEALRPLLPTAKDVADELRNRLAE